MIKKINSHYLSFDLHEGLPKTIIFLHGWGANKDSFKIFDKDFSSLTRVYVDLPGFGNSQFIKNSNIFDYSNSIKSLIDFLKLENITLVCHSFGARIGLILASKYPQLIDNLVICNGAGIKPRFSILNKIRILRYKLAKQKVLENKKDSASLNVGSVDYKSLTNDMKQTFISIINTDLSYVLPDIHQRVLLIWGKSDKSTPIYMAKKMKKYIPDSILKIFSGGHFTYLENYDKVLKEIKKFLGE